MGLFGLSNQECDPFAAYTVVFNDPAVTIQHVSNLFALFDQNARQNCDASGTHGSNDFSKELNDDVCSEIAQQEIHGFGTHRINRSAIRRHAVNIPFDVFNGNLYRICVVIATGDPLKSQQPCRDRQNSRPRSQIHNLTRGVDSLPQGFEKFQRELRCFVGSRAKRLAGINADGKAVRWAPGIRPARDDVEARPDREADIRLLPLSQPVAFSDGSHGYRWRRQTRSNKNFVKANFDILHIRVCTEEGFEAGDTGGRFAVLPESCGSALGEFADDGIFQFFRNVDGELQSAAAQLAEDFLHAVEKLFFCRTVVVFESGTELQDEFPLFAG